MRVRKKQGDKTKFFVMVPGESIRIKPHTYHSFVGLEDSVIIEVSTNHKDIDSYRLDMSRILTEEEIKLYNRMYNKSGKRKNLKTNKKPWYKKIIKN